VHRRGLVDAPGDGLEILDVEGEGPEVAVPADDVQGMVGVDEPRNPLPRLDPHLEFP
jgi:hypothetical protein